MNEVIHDRRIVQSRQTLKEAFLELLRENELQKITIKMIIGRSNVTRGTFYNHFSDKKTFVDDVLDREADDLFEAYRHHEKEGMDPLTSVFQHVYEQRDFYAVMLTSCLRTACRESLNNVLNQIFSERFANNVSLSESERSLKATMFAHAIEGLILEWTAANFHYRPHYISDQACRHLASE